MEAFWNKVEKTEGCWLWKGGKNGNKANGINYGLIKIPKTRKNITAHRLSYILHNGEITSEQWVLHKCDNPICVNPDHLFLGDAKSNVHDMISKGRRVIGDQKGELNGRSIMTQESVNEMRKLKGTMPISALCARYGISKSQAHRILTNQQWANA